MRTRTAAALGLTAATAVSTWAAEAAGAQEEQPNLFNADIGNFILTLIIFGLVIVILGRFAWKPLLKVLHERAQDIRESLESARREREEARRLSAEHEARLARAREEASAIVEEGRRDAEAVRRRGQEDARRQTEEMLERARREIKLATDTALKEIYDQTAELAVRVAGGVLKKELRPEDHKRLISESLEQMKGQQAARGNGRHGDPG